MLFDKISLVPNIKFEKKKMDLDFLIYPNPHKKIKKKKFE